MPVGMGPPAANPETGDGPGRWALFVPAPEPVNA